MMRSNMQVLITFRTCWHRSRVTSDRHDSLEGDYSQHLQKETEV